jgi:hypothetical protein
VTCQNDVPANVLDGDASTRWSTGVNQASNQWFQVDMRTAQVFDGLSIDATTSSGDYPRGFQVFVSNDGINWGAAIATGTGTAPLVTVSFPQQSARYFRVVLNKSSSTNWWSIGELNVYRAREAGTVQAIAECILPQTDGTYKAVFGYNSSAPSGDTISIPVGTNNRFETGTPGRGQPTSFAPGRHTAQFIVPFDGKALTWAVDGSSSTASAMLPTCVAACTQHLTDMTMPRIDTALTAAAAPLSIEDSAAQRDAFRWSDVLPVPETFADGSPRLYYGLFFIDGPGTALAMDALRIHYDNIPLFDTEFNSLKGQGLQSLSYPNDGQGQFVYGLVPGAVYNALRQAAMDTTTPTEIFRAAPLRPMPANDMGLATVSSCGLVPVAQCVAKASNGSLRAVFSYNNPSGAGVTIPLGPDNVLSGASGAVAVPEAFAAGSHTAVFAAPFASGSTVTWQLGGTTVSLNSSSPLCSATVVNQIGADTFNPFPPAPAPTCRPATPNEVQFPQSHLPPAARLNTCVSMSYNFASSVGLLWRGVDNDAADAAGQAADAALALADSVPDVVAAPAGSTANVQVVQSALFGKIFRKVIQKVASVAKTVVDDGRRVLRAGVGLFIGSSDVTITTVPINSDPLVGTINSPMLTAWTSGVPGAGFKKPVSLAGVQIRASKGPFLSVGNLDGSNKAGIKVLNHLGAHICYTASTPAAKVVDGWMLPVTVCPDAFYGSSISGSPPAEQTVKAPDERMHILAQMNDVHSYMQRVQNFGTDQAEALVGTVPDLIGRINQNRAFTPCFSFSWQNDVVQFMSALGGVAAEHVNDYLISGLESGATALARETAKVATKLEAQAAQLTTVAAQAAGTALASAANTARDVARNAATAARAAANQAQVLAQDAGDSVQAIGTAARKVTNNDPSVVAAENAAQATIDELKNKAPSVKNAVQAAANAATDASVATATLLIATGGAVASPVIDGIDKETHVAAEAGARALDLVGKVALDAEKAGAKRLGEVIGQLIGASPLGQVFEFLAGGDILFPAAGGDDINLISRGVATHEYGHFTLCSLLDRISPSSFARVYDEAASQGLVTMQSVSATSAVLNESFADLISSQVAAGTNYAQPDNAVFGTLMSFCRSSGTDCIETNVTNDSVGSSFPRAVLRNVSMYTDAIDSPFTVLADQPQNGRAWDDSAPVLDVADSPGVGKNGEEVVSLINGAIPRWIRHTLERDRTVLTENSMFGALSDTMIDQSYNWCQRCEIFALHTVDTASMAKPAICPTAWVGPRPTITFNGTTMPMTCIFDNGGVCPSSPVPTSPGAVSRFCEPNCPTGFHFDIVAMSCVGDVIIP